ncbi:hypothetical protein [Oceanicaulis alexandrii]|uniref:hypothetical protein n=1 Tax=Oceanicaulis alexandrii TaxID=153233 RepID=UPI002354C15A|nr:hypothetical protein [Oceanicaulis alexandrii]
MSLLIDIAHLILAATLSFLGLGYEREDAAHAIQLAPHQVETLSGGALLTPATFSVSAQNTQSLCAPSLVIAPAESAPGALPAQSTPQVIILNDCETLSLRRALPAL